MGKRFHPADSINQSGRQFRNADPPFYGFHHGLGQDSFQFFDITRPGILVKYIEYFRSHRPGTELGRRCRLIYPTADQRQQVGPPFPQRRNGQRNGRQRLNPGNPLFP